MTPPTVSQDPGTAKAEIAKLARARLKDAKALLRARRYDGAYYLCGYSVELALKGRICRTLRWTHFPQSGNDTRSLRTHDLELLLKFSGVEPRVKTQHGGEWSKVFEWNAEKRYDPVGRVTQTQASDMVTASTTLINYLLS